MISEVLWSDKVQVNVLMHVEPITSTLVTSVSNAQLLAMDALMQQLPVVPLALLPQFSITHNVSPHVLQATTTTLVSVQFVLARALLAPFRLLTAQPASTLHISMATLAVQIALQPQAPMPITQLGLAKPA